MATLRMLLAEHAIAFKLFLMFIALVSLAVLGQLAVLCSPVGFLAVLGWTVYSLAPLSYGRGDYASHGTRHGVSPHFNNHGHGYGGEHSSGSHSSGDGGGFGGGGGDGGGGGGSIGGG